MINYDQEKEIAFQAVKEAARLCQRVQNEITPDVLQKKDRSPVTVADFGSQALICRQLAEAFPDDPVIAEENAKALRQPGNAHLRQQVLSHIRKFYPTADETDVCDWIDHGNASEYSDRFWTLDPIDGTKGFLRGEQYAVALALIINGEIQVSALACPNLSVQNGKSGGTIFLAGRNEGAFEYSMENTDSFRPISVSLTDDSRNAKLCESVESGHSSHSDSAVISSNLQIATTPVRLDSQAKYAAVARGQADIYLRLPTSNEYREKIWDHAGGWLIVKEAGGQVTDIHGKPLDFTHGKTLRENRGVIVSNSLLHDTVLAAVKKAGIT